jgi:hypothetical protein
LADTLATKEEKKSSLAILTTLPASVYSAILCLLRPQPHFSVTITHDYASASTIVNNIIFPYYAKHLTGYQLTGA